MFGIGMAVGCVFGGTVGVIFTALAVAGKREDEQMAALFEKERYKRKICFLDKNANRLFSIPDGGYLELAAGNGEKQICICNYVDDDHMKISGTLWQALDFAKQMEGRGIAYRPLPQQEERERQVTG